MILSFKKICSIQNTFFALGITDFQQKEVASLIKLLLSSSNYVPLKSKNYPKVFRNRMFKSQNEASDIVLDAIKLKLWHKTFIACTKTRGRGGASSRSQRLAASSTCNLVKNSRILDLFGSKYIRKKRGIRWWCQILK